MSGVRQVVVGVHGSLGSLQALRYAAGEARDRGALLVAVWSRTGPAPGCAEPDGLAGYPRIAG